MVDDGTDISVKVSKTRNKRLDELKKFFLDEFHIEPTYFVKVPGR